MSAGVGTILKRLLSHARLSGKPERARISEYKTPPGDGLSFAVWLQGLGSAPDAGGLGVTAALLHVTTRWYMPMLHRPEEDIEIKIGDAADAYLARLNVDYGLGGAVRNVDILGEFGDPLAWSFGYVMIDKTMYRIADLPLMMVINDVWTQGG